MEKSSPTINLAKNRGEHFIDRFFSWALSIGRVLVIATEAIALGAFLFRFGLDRQILDLNDRINQEKVIVGLLKNNETTYHNVQDRLLLAKTIDADTTTQLKTLLDLTSFFPSDMVVQNIFYSTTDIHIDASVGSVVSLSTFVKKLKAYTSIAKVSIDKLENKSATGEYTIGLTATFKTTKQKTLL